MVVRVFLGGAGIVTGVPDESPSNWLVEERKADNIYHGLVGAEGRGGRCGSRNSVKTTRIE